MTPIALPNTPEWHAMRQRGIGASEAAAACGLSDYETPLHVYLRKRGELPAVEETAAMRRGRRWEPYVLDTFAEQTGMLIAQSPCGLYQHPRYSFLLATPDAVLENGEAVDAKTTTWRSAKKFGAEGTDSLPAEYVIQGQQQMAVIGAEVCHFAVMLDVWTLRVYRVERDENVIDGLIRTEGELWERIINGDPPEPAFGHGRTADLIGRIHGTISDERIILSDRAVAAWTEYENLGRLMREAEKQRDELKAVVLHEIGDRYAGLLPGGRMVRRKRIVTEVKAHTKDYIDASAVKADVVENVPNAGVRRVVHANRKDAVQRVPDL